MLQGECGTVTGKYAIRGNILVFYGYIKELSVSQGGWRIIAKVPSPYKTDVVFMFSPLIGATGDTNLYRRDGDINGGDIRAYLYNDDSGKRINFCGIMVM